MCCRRNGYWLFQKNLEELLAIGNISANTFSPKMYVLKSGAVWFMRDVMLGAYQLFIEISEAYDINIENK